MLMTVSRPYTAPGGWRKSFVLQNHSQTATIKLTTPQTTKGFPILSLHTTLYHKENNDIFLQHDGTNGPEDPQWDPQ